MNLKQVPTNLRSPYQMNLLLLTPDDLLNENQARIDFKSNPTRLKHIIETLGAQEGDSLSCGIENGKLGRGIICQINSNAIEIEFDCQENPPNPVPLKLFIALPRPKMLKRIVQTAATMGVKELHFINSWKVEKSYWQSPWLQEDKLRDNLILGLEQAKDTILPAVYQHKLFKPFVEDKLEVLTENTLRLVAHPGESQPCPINSDQAISMVIGPEGGFTPYEIGKLKEVGFEGVSLGERILRVETAVTSIISRLYCR